MAASIDNDRDRANSPPSTGRDRTTRAARRQQLQQRQETRLRTPAGTAPLQKLIIHTDIRPQSSSGARIGRLSSRVSRQDRQSASTRLAQGKPRQLNSAPLTRQPDNSGLQAPFTQPSQPPRNRRSVRDVGESRAYAKGDRKRIAPKNQDSIPRNAKPRRDESRPYNSKPQAKNSTRRVSPLLYAARLLILGVGVGAIAGTLLSASDPAAHLDEKNVSQKSGVETRSLGVSKSADKTQESLVHSAPSTLGPIKLTQEITAFTTYLEALAKQNSKLQPGVFLVDIDTGAYFDSQGETTFSAASTIKLPILVALFQDVDAGKIRLDEKLTLKQEMIGSGSGDLQYKKLGTKYTALEVATKMIAISDNTATNMLISRMGGASALNQRFRSWGLTATAIQNPLPDLEGTNTTSPKELANVMAMVNQGDLVSMPSRDRMLDIMQRTVTNSMLPKGLGNGATISHKTGDIGSLVADVGLIDMPSGKRYIAAVMVKRPHNDNRAQELIRKISRAAYQYFDTGAFSPSLPPSPSTTTTPVAKPPATRNG